MSKFSNKPFTPSTQSSSGNGGDYKEVDWAKYNTYIAGVVQEATGCDEGTPSSCIGIISGIVDLGKHQDPERVEAMDDGDAGTKEWKQRMVEKGKAIVDEDGMFHYQANPCQEVTFYVDFPAITVDKGQFFGDSNPAPYRVLLGGVFKGVPAQTTKIQGYPNSDKVWVFGDKNRATKLAKAAKITGIKDGFAQDRLLELIGKPIQFSLEVFVNEAGFLQEKVTNPSPLMAGIPIPEYDENLLFYVGFNEDNEDDYVKVLTKPVKEYIKTALDFEGSKLQKQLDALENSQAKSEDKTYKAKQSPSVEDKVENTASQGGVDDVPMDFDYLDSEIPF